MLLLGVSLKAVWSLVNTLQILIFYTDIKSNLAPHAIQVLDILKTVALFQFIPSSWFTDRLKATLTDVDLASIGQDNYIESTGNLLIIGLALGLVTVMVLILTLLCKKSAQFHKVLDFIKMKLFWNSFIRYSLQSYLKLAFANLIVAQVMLVLPVVYTLVLLKNRVNLKESRVIQRIGSLTLGIRNYNIAQTLYSVVFLLRRVVFVAIVLSFKD